MRDSYGAAKAAPLRETDRSEKVVLALLREASGAKAPVYSQHVLTVRLKSCPDTNRSRRRLFPPATAGEAVPFQNIARKDFFSAPIAEVIPRVDSSRAKARLE
jgi:hypothetical protein